MEHGAADRPTTPPMETSAVARRIKKSSDTVRYYERIGRLRAMKTTSGTRLFDPADVERLAEELEGRKP